MVLISLDGVNIYTFFFDLPEKHHRTRKHDHIHEVFIADSSHDSCHFGRRNWHGTQSTQNDEIAHAGHCYLLVQSEVSRSPYGRDDLKVQCLSADIFCDEARQTK